MRITILTMGSRGDVQPFIALGRALTRRGHRVKLATHAVFAESIRARGLEFAPLEGNIRALMETDAVQSTLRSGSNPLLFVPRFVRAAEPLLRDTMRDMLAACAGANAVVLGGIGFYGGADVAAKLGLRFAIAAVQPMGVTRSVPSIFFPVAPRWLPLRGSYNALTHYLFGYMFWLAVRGPLNKARAQVLGLGPVPLRLPYARLEREGMISVYGVSPAVFARPPDWPACYKITGYWFLDRPGAWQPPAELLAFLDAGPAPVYVGFGSMHEREAGRLTQMAVAALREAGQRGILLTGWGGLERPAGAEDMFALDAVPHDWLFPRMAAAVHHGGAGTTAAALRAGVPQVVIPYMGDQPYWARRVHELGAGPAPIPRRRLSAAGLAAAIGAAAGAPAIRSAAAALGERIRGENGAACAAEELERYFGA